MKNNEKPLTMDELYGDGSNHIACKKCGFCSTCNDCKCYNKSVDLK